MVYICTMKHSNLQIKCKSFVAFKVLMLLQVFCCSFFENLLVLKFFYYYQNYFGFVILLLLSRFFCFCGFAACIIHLFAVLFVFVVSFGSCGTSLQIALFNYCEFECILTFCLQMPPFKPPPNFKFKYFYTSCNLIDGTPLVDSNVAFSNRGDTQSERELIASKRKMSLMCL